MDKEEFAEVVINATDSLYRVSFAILENEADCEDAVGEAISTAFSKLYTLRQEKYAKTWLTKILIRECYRTLKLRKRTVSAGDDMDNIIEFSDRMERPDYSELYEALGKLSKEQRTVIGKIMIDNRLWEMFPETPDSFRKMVKQTVADQLTIERKRNVFRMPRAAAVAVILVLVAGTTVGAANISKLKTYLAKWGYKVPEENVVSYEDKEQTGMVQGNLLEATSDTNMEDKSMDDEKASMSYDEIRDSLSELEQQKPGCIKESIH